MRLSIFRARTGTRRGLRLLCTAVLAGACAAAPSAHATGSADEAAVQAAFVYNFARFTEWPPAALAARPGPLNVCLVGRRDALAGALESLSGRTVQNHPVRVLNMPAPEDLKSCHVVFLAEADSVRRSQVLQALADTPALTVSDSPDFARRGGMIGLVRVGDKLRFEINRGEAQVAGLKLSASLLNLAVGVLDAPGSRSSESSR